MNQRSRFLIKYWGVRGSIPTPGSDMVRYGGNTSCVQVQCGDHNIILDGGTGLRMLGDQMLREEGPVSALVFFTHFHWDHIQGFPFFRPLYRNDTNLTVIAFEQEGMNTFEVLQKQMDHPTFPITLDQVPANLTTREINVSDTIELDGGVRLDFAALNHPGGAVGVRVSYLDKSIAHITDNEHLEDGILDGVRRLAQGADYMTYDAAYTTEEYEGIGCPPRKGWGHSTWREGIRTAEELDVGNLVIFHHDFGHDDAALDDIHAKARALFPNSLMAREGMEIDVLTGEITYPEE